MNYINWETELMYYNLILYASQTLRKKELKITELPKSNGGTITLTTEEFDKLETAFCKGKGWGRDGSTNLHRIVLRGNYKWHPLTDVELDISVKGAPEGRTTLQMS